RRIAASRREGHLRGFENLDFSLVRVGGLGLYSHEFYSLGLKFTPMGNTMSLRKINVVSSFEVC
ncbi:MAG TPA: hypothetical protein VK203_14450, partial [Nostocaceae cyanobacterium]|nr:hypothetical protein [Nostocaceae cyanobacterium]